MSRQPTSHTSLVVAIARQHHLSVTERFENENATCTTDTSTASKASLQDLTFPV